MTVATVTSKGQVVIPIEIRKQLNLHPGDKLDFEFDPEQGCVHVSPIGKSIDDVFGMLKGKTNKAFAAEEIDCALSAAFRADKL